MFVHEFCFVRVFFFSLNPFGDLGSARQVATIVDGPCEFELNLISLESLDDFVVGEPGEEHFMKMRDVHDWARSHPNYKQSEDYGTKMGEIARSMVGVFGG